MTEYASLRDRIGGPHAFSWRVWLIVTTVGIPFSVLIDLHGVLSLTTVAHVATATAATGATSALIFLAVARLRPPACSLPVAVAIAVALLTSVMRAVLAPVILGQLGEDISVTERLIATALPVTILILALNAGIESLTTLREQRSALVTTLIELNERKLQQQALTEAMTNALLTNVLTATVDLRRQVVDAAPPDSADERLEVAAALRSTAMGSLRELSHDLHASSFAHEARGPGLLRTFMTALRTNPLWPIETAAVSALIASFGAIFVGVRFSAADQPTAVIATLAIVIVWVVTQFLGVWLALRAIVVLGDHWRLPGMVKLLLAISATAIISAARTAITFDLVGAPSGSSLIATSVAAALLVVLGTTVAMATQQSQEDLVESLRTTVDASEAEAIARNHELVRASRTLARYVHGTLQSRLLASALAIEQAERDGDPAAFDAALQQAREALSLPDAFAAPATDLAAALQTTVDLWQGFAAITIEVPVPAPTVDPETVADLCRVVEEAVANAMRHGDATTITVAVTATDERLDVVVTDDGTGPHGGGPGLGTTLFDVTGAWSLVARQDRSGAVLTMRMPQRARRLVPQPD